MKIILALLTLAAVAFLWLACRNTKYTLGNLPGFQLRWGNGGGFAGIETTFILLDNGQVFKQTGKDAPSEIKNAGAKKAKSLYKMIETLGLEKIDFLHPGNTYDFVEVFRDDRAKRIAWGAKDYPVDTKILDFYRQLDEIANP
jgi:hypothetical protein